MTNMKKSILLAAVAVLLVSFCLVSSARCVRSVQAAPADTLVINTTELCKDVIGYDGPTPLVIKVVNGVVAKVEALPNTESPSYFERVIQGGLLKAVVGKKVSEAAKMKLRGRHREPSRRPCRSRPEVISSFPEKFYLCGD